MIPRVGSRIAASDDAMSLNGIGVTSDFVHMAKAAGGYRFGCRGFTFRHGKVPLCGPCGGTSCPRRLRTGSSFPDARRQHSLTIRAAVVDDPDQAAELVEDLKTAVGQYRGVQPTFRAKRDSIRTRTRQG